MKFGVSPAPYNECNDGLYYWVFVLPTVGVLKPPGVFKALLASN